MPSSCVATARTLQQLLEAEGAVFHRAMSAKAMPSMGGGVGVAVTEPRGLRTATVLATLPFRCMITTKKARLNLAMAEVALAEAKAVAASSASSPSPSCVASPFVLPLTAHVWESERSAALESAWGTPRYRAVRIKEEELERKLSPTDTIVSYLLLLASLYGRWQQPQPHHQCSNDGVNSTVSAASDHSTVTLSFTHENAWMRTWLMALPEQYDNLLELQPTHGAPTEPACTAFLAHYIPFARQVDKVRREQRALYNRFEHCRLLLACLREALVGVELRTTPSDAVRETAAVPPPPPSCVQFAQFRWAFNTLMSRGFAFEEDVWAMMPWVDYFNYALLANGSMSWHAASGSSATGRRAYTRKTAHPRSPNDYVYRFELVQPVRGGSQVYLHYGAYSDFELLQWYGFRLGGFLLPTALMAEAVDTAPAVCASSDMRSVLFNPLLHDAGTMWTHAACDDEEAPPTAESTASSDHDVSGVPASVKSLLDDAVHRQSVFTRFLPVLVCADTREKAFEVFWRAQEAQRCADVASMSTSVQAEGVKDVPSHEEEEEDRRQAAYEEWCQSTQRACSYALSPYADTDGNYPPPGKDGATWIHALLRALHESPASVSSHDTVTHLDAWTRTLARVLPEITDVHDAELAACTQKNCFLGPLGCSQRLSDAFDHITRRLLQHPLCWELLPAEAVKEPRWPRRAFLRRQLVRAVAWSELSVSWTGITCLPEAEFDGAAAPSSLHAFLSCASREAAKMAFSASCDAWTLLHYLALEATDDALDEYVQYEDAYYG